VAGFATLCWVDMECANPSELAEFYRQVLGWGVTHYPDESAVITDGSTSIRFGRVDGYSRRAGLTRPRPSATTWTWTSIMSRRLLSGAWSWARASLISSLVMATGGRFCSTRPGIRSVCPGLRRSKALVARADACPRYVAA
jgi:hypothetical protein